MIEQEKKENTRPGEILSRVGLFGGTFNPVHFGHLKVIQDVKDGFGLDRVYVVPSAVPPHKKLKSIVDAKDRLKMAQLCFMEHNGFSVSDVELKRKGPSFTIDTVKYYLSQLYGKAELFMIIGTDAFFEIHTWKSFQKILELVPLVVMVRPGDNMETDLLKEKKGGEYLDRNISTDYRWWKEECSFRHPAKQPVYFYDVTQLEISSTEIRRLVKQGKSPSGYVPANVSDYIKEKGLYL